MVEQERIDQIMIDLDGTENKCKDTVSNRAAIFTSHFSVFHPRNVDVCAWSRDVTRSFCLLSSDVNEFSLNVLIQILNKLWFLQPAKFGANAILGVSLAVCKAGAAERNVPLYRHIADLAGNSDVILPVPVWICFYKITYLLPDISSLSVQFIVLINPFTCTRPSM